MTAPASFKVSFGTVRALRFGRGSRRVLAVHGWLDNAASFIPLAPLIEDADVVAVDLAGHGQSDHRPAGANYHLVDYVPDVVEVADALGWTQFTLLGHSLGAGISSLIAAALPDRVEALCLVDGLGPISGSEQDCPKRLRRAINMRSAASDRPRRAYASVEDAVSARLGATRMQPDCARLIVERNLVATDDGFAWRTDRRVTFASPVYLSEPQVLAFLGAISCPALLVLADNGVIVRRESTPERIACVARLQVCELAGDHHLHMDNARAVAEAVNGFLGSLDARRD